MQVRKGYPIVNPFLMSGKNVDRPAQLQVGNKGNMNNFLSTCSYLNKNTGMVED